MSDSPEFRFSLTRISVPWRDWLVLLAVLSLMLLAVTIRSPDVAEAGLVESPGQFFDDYDGGMTTDGKRLFVAITGGNENGKVKTQVYARKRGSWKAISPKFRSLNLSATDVVLVRFPRRKRKVPCVTYTDRKQIGQVRCRLNGSWKILPVARSLRQMDLGYASAYRGKLVVLFSKFSPPAKEPTTTKLRVGTLKHGRIVPRGPVGVFENHNVAALGLRTAATKTGRIDVAMADLWDRRYVATLGPKGWSRTKSLPKMYPGSQFSVVRSRKSLFTPSQSNHPDGSLASFSIYRKQPKRSWKLVDGTPLRVGTGIPQGALAPVGNRIWTIWEEYSLWGDDGKRIGPTHVYATLVNRKGTAIERTVPLWSGPTEFPGVYDAVKYKGGPAFLYSRSLSDDNRLFVTVDLSHLCD